VFVYPVEDTDVDWHSETLWFFVFLASMLAAFRSLRKEGRQVALPTYLADQFNKTAGCDLPIHLVELTVLPLPARPAGGGPFLKALACH
jgi:hypothetical protein